MKKPFLSPKGYVYLIENPHAKMLKIGYSKNPYARMRTFHTAAPQLRLLAIRPGTIQDEHRAHSIFQAYHYTKEWYHDSPQIRKYFSQIVPKWKYYFIATMISIVTIISFLSQWSR